MDVIQDSGIRSEFFKVLSWSPQKRLIEAYKQQFRTEDIEKEHYKWELLRDQKGKPELGNGQLLEDIKSMNFSNLIYHLSSAVLKELVENFPDEMNTLFAHLFDENKDLNIRLNYFKKNTKTLYEKLGKTNQHHQDERAIATYLTFHNPARYTFYKSSYYKSYCQMLGIKPTKSGQRLVHYYQLVDDLVNEYIEGDKELRNLVESNLPNGCDANNMRLIAQDILFTQLEKKEE
ncbi:unnamed protein product, partial [Chrysoparadoxa australica]